MKKTKPKSEQKASKKAGKKDAKKVARKELGAHLSAKFKEVIESLGHEAEAIAKDIEKAGKFLSKKLSDKKIKKDAASSSLIKTLDSAIEQVKEREVETAEQGPVKGAIDENLKPATPRRRAAATKTEAVAEKPVEKRTRTAPKTADSGPRASRVTTARRTAKKAGTSNVEATVASPDAMAQDQETKE